MISGLEMEWDYFGRKRMDKKRKQVKQMKKGKNKKSKR